MSQNAFPPGFLWGTATASYQIEGGAREDGRSPSIWDTFSRTPGKVLNGDTGDVACDHYHRWPEDIALMKTLGTGAYRFSVAWPRVMPGGTGPVNAAGLDFYSRLVDALLENGIQPCVTLYHWDLPQVLHDRGGWPDRSIVEAFTAYTDAVTRRLGDRVKMWITLNEPWVFAFAGHYQARHAPGLRDLKAALAAAHNALLAHGQAVPVIRANVPQAEVGITLNTSLTYPASDSLLDRAAAYRYDGYLNRWFGDAVFGQGYPADMRAFYGEALLPDVRPGDMETMAVPLDFLGINTYAPIFVKNVSPEVNELGFQALTADELHALGYETTTMNWPVVPDAFRALLVRLAKTYTPPAIYVTENGAAFEDRVEGDRVHDPRRVAYLRAHVGAVRQAIEQGAPVKGYFVWSLLDNFEWAWGYSQRFGLVYVDYAGQQRRIPKDSFDWVRRTVQANALQPEG